MEHAQQLPNEFPWRTAALVVGAIALVELIVLLSLGVVHLVPKKHAATATTRVVTHRVAASKAPPVPTHPLRARNTVHVLVLNGNGVQGAAASEASRLQLEGYRIAGARNAARHNYAQSMVLYVPGWIKEARRLAHDAGVGMVAPVDGLRPSSLKGSKLVVVLGSA